MSCGETDSATRLPGRGLDRTVGGSVCSLGPACGGSLLWRPLRYPLAGASSSNRPAVQELSLLKKTAAASSVAENRTEMAPAAGTLQTSPVLSNSKALASGISLISP